MCRRRLDEHGAPSATPARSWVHEPGTLAPVGRLPNRACAYARVATAVVDHGPPLRRRPVSAAGDLLAQELQLEPSLLRCGELRLGGRKVAAGRAEGLGVADIKGRIGELLLQR